jgi:hypothetical protein
MLIYFQGLPDTHSAATAETSSSWAARSIVSIVSTDSSILSNPQAYQQSFESRRTSTTTVGSPSSTKPSSPVPTLCTRSRNSLELSSTEDHEVYNSSLNSSKTSCSGPKLYSIYNTPFLTVDDDLPGSFEEYQKQSPRPYEPYQPQLPTILAPPVNTLETCSTASLKAVDFPPQIKKDTPLSSYFQGEEEDMDIQQYEYEDDAARRERWADEIAERMAGKKRKMDVTRIKRDIERRKMARRTVIFTDVQDDCAIESEDDWEDDD